MPELTAVPPRPQLAEPPIPGGKVEAQMGKLIKVLSASRLTRPKVAVTLSALGLGGVAFVGLCAPNSATVPVLLPLTALARQLGAPGLSDVVTNLVMYPAILLCCLGLAGMLWANSKGWDPDPRRVFWTAVAAIAVCVNITPVGSSDTASYAADGRIAALGRDPYVLTPYNLPGGAHNAYTALVGTTWYKTPSVYGPVATWIQLFAARIGGGKPWETIWVILVCTAIAFALAGYVLLRTAANPVRATLLWVANPLLIEQLVLGGQLDAYLALAGIVAILISRRGSSVWHDIPAGILVGVAGGIKITAVFVGFGIAVPLLRERAWWRLVRTGAAAMATTAALYGFSYGLHALWPAFRDSTMVISPSGWRLAQIAFDHLYPTHTAGISTVFGYLWPPLTLALAWYLYNRLSPDVPAAVAATCALTFAWVIVTPWSLPWYASVAWVALALLPRNALTRWLTLATGTLAILHFNGSHPMNTPIGPTP
ncbi:MAG TPA: hypothetical protein VGG83_26995 [Trebonia sp.]|jgi:hypothetical protein